MTRRSRSSSRPQIQRKECFAINQPTRDINGGKGKAYPSVRVTSTVMPIQTVQLTLPPSADPSKLADFGREVIGVDPGNLSSSEFAEIRQLLYKVPIFHSDTLQLSLISSSSSTMSSSSEMQTFLPSSSMR